MTLIELIQVSAEMIGRPLSAPAIAMMALELADYPHADVRAALARLCRECPPRMTLAEITRRLPGAHVGPHEAWAIACRADDESSSVVWTDEIAEAFGAVRHIDDRNTARFAFRDAYERILGEHSGAPAVWRLSPGHDPHGRAQAIRDAVAARRLPHDSVKRLLGHEPAPRLERSTADPLRLAAALEITS